MSGGAAGGGQTAEFELGEADTRAEAVVDRLGDLYWQKWSNQYSTHLHDFGG